MRRCLPRAWFVIAMGASLAGCWLVAGLEDRPLSRDGEAGSPEASGDTGGEFIPLEDAATATDAGVDSTCSASLARFVLCDDFDNGGYRSEWTPTTTGPAQLGIVGTPNVSAPFALSARTTAIAPADNLVARLTKSVAATNTAYSLEARVRLPAATTGPRASSSPIAMSITLSTEIEAIFQVRTQGEAAACVIPGQQLGVDLPFTYGDWHRVVLRVTPTGSGYDFSCDVDGLVRTGSKGNGTGVSPTTTTFQVGLVTFGGESPTLLYFDDVLVDAR